MNLILTIPKEVWYMIFSNLSTKDLTDLRLSNSNLNTIICNYDKNFISLKVCKFINKINDPFILNKLKNECEKRYDKMNSKFIPPYLTSIKSLIIGTNHDEEYDGTRSISVKYDIKFLGKFMITMITEFYSAGGWDLYTTVAFEKMEDLNDSSSTESIHEKLCITEPSLGRFHLEVCNDKCTPHEVYEYHLKKREYGHIIKKLLDRGFLGSYSGNIKMKLIQKANKEFKEVLCKHLCYYFCKYRKKYGWIIYKLHNL